MTTLELIKQARKCADSYGCDECIYYNTGECNSVMMERLADRLEKAFDEIHKDCSNCKYKELGTEENPCHSCFGCYGDGDNQWKWRGDAE